MKKSTIIQIILGIGILLALSIIIYLQPQTGKNIGSNVVKYGLVMVKMLPLTMILIAVLEVWVPREKVERHLGDGGGFVSYIWAILLGGTTIGPMIVALPVSAALFRKGARLSVIFTYVFAASVCRIPMTIFESSYLGVKFTLIRYAVAIPLILGVSILFDRFLQGKDYKIKEM